MFTLGITFESWLCLVWAIMYRPMCDCLYRWCLTLSGNSRKGRRKHAWMVSPYESWGKTSSLELAYGRLDGIWVEWPERRSFHFRLIYFYDLSIYLREGGKYFLYILKGEWWISQKDDIIYIYYTTHLS